MERLEKEEFDKRRILEAKAGLIAEKQLERKEKELNKQLTDENKRLEFEQRSHQEFLNKVVYTNQPTAAYFMQFNTTTRWTPSVNINAVATTTATQHSHQMKRHSYLLLLFFFQTFNINFKIAELFARTIATSLFVIR